MVLVYLCVFSPVITRLNRELTTTRYTLLLLPSEIVSGVAPLKALAQAITKSLK